jgi:antirestriction protein ArdC
VATAIVSHAVCSAVCPGVDSTRPRASVYDIVTERILAELEKGQVPWRKPWRCLPPANLISKKPYRGINMFLLALAGYGSQYWLTYRQAQALGGNVRKGEHGTKIIFWKFLVASSLSRKGRRSMRLSYKLFLSYSFDSTKVAKPIRQSSSWRNSDAVGRFVVFNISHNRCRLIVTIKYK